MCFGDPITASNGNKYETRVEYPGQADGTLRFKWTYNSKGVPSFIHSDWSALGRNRVFSYSQMLALISYEGSSQASVTREDGKVSSFIADQAGGWIPAAGIKERLRDVVLGGVLVGRDLDDGKGNIEHFNLAGKLTAITRRSGSTESVAYDSSGRISSVSDSAGRRLSFTYLSRTQIGSMRLPDGGIITFGYTRNGDLNRVVYPGGSEIGYLYDEGNLNSGTTVRGLLTGVIDEEGGRISTTSYDVSGRATGTFLGGGVDAYAAAYTAAANGSYFSTASIALPTGGAREVSIGLVNRNARTASIKETCVGCSPKTRAMSYDGNGHLDVVNDNGQVIDNDFDIRGNLTRKVETSGDGLSPLRTLEQDWDATKNVRIASRLRDSSGAMVASTMETYGPRGQHLSITKENPATGAGRTTAFIYCEEADVLGGMCPRVGLIVSIDGYRTDVNDVSTFTYRQNDDASCAASPGTCLYRKGDLWKVTNAKGQVVETLKYDGAGRPLSVKDPNGVITDYEYHPRGWLTASKVRGPDNAVETDDAITRVAYWPTGLVQRVTQPDGAFTLYTYDAAHRLTDISDNAGNTIHYVLDNAGNRLAEETKDAGGALKRTLSRIYNQLGQLATQADAQANPTDFTYDANGNANTVTDALGRVTDHDHDPLNRLARTLQDVGGIAAETKFQYDALDNLTKVTDPKGLDTSYTYNGLGDLTQLQSPDTGTTTYTYDSAGNRASQTDARGVTTTYAHDVLNRLTAVNYPDTALNVSYTYDSAPTVCEAGETFGVGRLSGMDDASGSTRYCYNRFGHLVRKVQTTNGVNFVVRYTYTLAGNLQAMVYPDGTTVDYGRNAQGQVTEVGVTRSGQPRQVLLHQATYHPFGPVAGWTYGNGRTLSRTLDQDYRPLTIEDPNTGGLSLGFGYDAVGNLTTLGTAQGVANPAIRFGYDALGRLTRTEDGPTQAAIDVYAYDATGNRTAHTTAAGTSAYTYPTTNHRLTDVAGVPRTYDAVGNTTAIGGTRGFAYNDANRMSGVQQSGMTTRQYAYNGRGEQVRRYLGATNTYTVYDEAGHWLGDYDDSGAPLQQALWMDDLPVGLLANGNQVHYLQPDHLGSPRVVIEAARNVPVWTWDLKGEAFGSTAPQQDPDGDGIPFVLDMRFPGQRYDVASNLYYNYFRDYEPGSGRYIQSDSIGLSGGISTFAYTGRSPLLFVDPQGLQACRTTYGVFFNVISCEPVGMASTGAAAGSNRGLYNPAEQSIMAKYCKGDDKCEELKLNVNKFIDIAEGQIDRMRRDRFIHNLYELARHEPNFAATGTHTTWEGHQSTTRELLELIRNMINLGHKLGCNMGAEYDRYVALQLPGIPDP